MADENRPYQLKLLVPKTSKPRTDKLIRNYIPHIYHVKVALLDKPLRYKKHTYLPQLTQRSDARSLEQKQQLIKGCVNECSS